MRPVMCFLAITVAAATLVREARADIAGERHLIASQPTAALRDSEHRAQLRITVWYPASPEAEERSLDLGPGTPMFVVDKAAANAGSVDDRRRPVILFSHGYGGTARIMTWFTTALARAGLVVVAVDHPGSNGADPITAEGSVLIWDRPDDLRLALATAETDPLIGAHLDPQRIGVAGFSAGGFTALAAAGGQVNVGHFLDFCATHPDDGVCRPQN